MQWPAARLAPLAAKVVLLDDCFTTFQEPQIGRAAVELLERAGYAVELAGVCCGRAMISKGFLADARDLARRSLARLDRFAAAGVPILGLEPSCLLTLADEWPELVPGPAAAAGRRRGRAGRGVARPAGARRRAVVRLAGRRARCCSTATATRRRWSASAGRPTPCGSSPGWT